jgi:chemotaxis protein MotA
MIDLGTVIGLVAGLSLLTWGIVITPGATLIMFYDLPSVFITFGGAVCSTLICFPLSDFRDLAGFMKKAFLSKPSSAIQIIKDFRRFADIARRDGILALENVTGEIKDPFLIKGIQLAVDGTDPEVIQSMLSTELEQMASRHEKGINIMKKMTSMLPSYGMIGTLIGLVIMLQNLKDPDAIGPAMGVAIITTFYGGVGAYLFAEPMAEKLSKRSGEELAVRELMIRGVMSIQSGDNPRIVEQKLKVFLPPRLRSELT